MSKRKKMSFISALMDWMFGVHGYVVMGMTNDYLPVAEQKCKVCGKDFKAWKHNDTCHNIKCFIKWRI